MKNGHLVEKAKQYLHTLCVSIPTRCVGSDGNRRATKFFADAISSFGFKTKCPEFDCMDWSQDSISLRVENQTFAAFISPYSVGCDIEAPLCIASTVEEMERIDASGKIILLQGHIAKEQLMPKNFPFYNPDEHKKVYRLLETKGLKAIIAATSRNPELAGGVYPFPLIEDGDFDIPSAYMTDVEGVKLAKCENKIASLQMVAHRKTAKGHNVIARKGEKEGGKIVVCAHIDSKMGTPGAIDNAAGTIVLLLLSELLSDYTGNLQIEIVALNGEDYYNSPGQVHYLESIKKTLPGILLAVNIDGAGYIEGKTSYSTYDCPEEIESVIRKVFSLQEDIIAGKQWYQSDHAIFIQNQRPAAAITSEFFLNLFNDITHTPKDKPAIVDCGKLTNAAAALRSLVLELADKLK
ncbi:M28 family peptidase [Acidobacteriota bacterium]